MGVALSSKSQPLSSIWCIFFQLLMQNYCPSLTFPTDLLWFRRRRLFFFFPVVLWKTGSYFRRLSQYPSASLVLPRSPSLSVWGSVRLTALHCSDRVRACFHPMSQPSEPQVFLIQTPNSPWRRLMSVVIDVHTNRNCTYCRCSLPHRLPPSLSS